MALQGIDVLLQEAGERPERGKNLQICWALLEVSQSVLISGHHQGSWPSLGIDKDHLETTSSFFV